MTYLNGFRSPRLAALLLAAGLSGCATTSFQSSDPAYRMQTEAAPLPAAIAGSARVAVRWTQIISPEAQAILEQNWIGRFNDVVYQNPVSLSESHSRPHAYQALPSDSTYYAAEFARLLGRRIPAADIVLEPLALDARDGKFVYRSLVRNRFPAQIVVDLWNAPRTHANPWAGATLVYSISTSGLASPATCGVLGFKPSRNLMPDFDASGCVRIEARDTPHPDLIYGFQGEKYTFATPVPLKPGVPLAPDRAVAFPQTYEPFTSQYLAASGDAHFDADKNLDNPTLDELAKVVADGLSRIDSSRSVQVAWNRYVGLYDPRLSQRIQTGVPQPADADKLRFIAKLADAERAWVVVQNQAVLKNLLDGDFGKSFRATRLAQDQAATKQQMMSMASMIAMAGAFSAASALGPAASSTAAMQANMNAMQIAVQSMADQKQNADDFYQKFGSELEARQQVTEIDYGGKMIHVQADNLGKLYAELGKLYQARFPGNGKAIGKKPSAQKS